MVVAADADADAVAVHADVDAHSLAHVGVTYADHHSIVDVHTHDTDRHIADTCTHP